MTTLIGELAEGLGGLLGETFWAETISYVLLVLYPLLMLRLGLLAAERFLPALAEPDYRRALVAVVTAQAAMLLIDVGLTLILFGTPRDLALLAIPIVVGAIALGLARKMSVWTLSIALAYELYRAGELIWLIGAANGAPEAIVAHVAQLLLVAGALIWIYIAFRVRQRSGKAGTG